MQNRTIQPCFLIALAVLCGNTARADYLNWTYTSNPNVPGISAGALSPNGGALVTLTNFSTPQAGALSIPVSELKRRVKQLPKRKEFVAYCRGPYCVLADQAIEVLKSHGRRARRLTEGFPEWRAAGLPVETGESQEPRP